MLGLFEARYFDVPASRMETIEDNVKQVAIQRYNDSTL